MRDLEVTLNARLASALRDLGFSAYDERPHGSNRHDIDVHFGSFLIAIEAKRSESPNAEKQVVADAQKRVKARIANIAVALRYPKGATAENLESQDLTWAVVKETNSSSVPDWDHGDINRFSDVLTKLPDELGDPDLLVKKISHSLDSGANVMSEGAKEIMTKMLDLPSNKAADLKASVKRGLLVITTAVMFHAKLDENASSERNHKHQDKGWPPMRASECMRQDNPAKAYADAWEVILKVDYGPIFESARELMLNLIQDRTANDAIRISANTALEVVGTAGSHRHDLLGRLFHKILHTAKYDGSFYTSSPAASMLAALALPEKKFKNLSEEEKANLKIVDVACGTGTLLMAAAERLASIDRRGKKGQKIKSKTIIENILHGFDTNLTALHMAATTLGLMSPNTEFKKMNLHRTRLGVQDGHAFLGSLSLLGKIERPLIPWVKYGFSRQIDSESYDSDVEKGGYDLVIMNPPYTRDSLRNKNFKAEEREKMQAREKTIFKKFRQDGTLHLSGQSGNFVVLAKWFLKGGGGENGGSIANGNRIQPIRLGDQKIYRATFQRRNYCHIMRS